MYSIQREQCNIFTIQPYTEQSNHITIRTKMLSEEQADNKTTNVNEMTFHFNSIVGICLRSVAIGYSGCCVQIIFVQPTSYRWNSKNFVQRPL